MYEVTATNGAAVQNYDGSYAGVSLPSGTRFDVDDLRSSPELLALGSNVAGHPRNALVGRYVRASDVGELVGGDPRYQYRVLAGTPYWNDPPSRGDGVAVGHVDSDHDLAAVDVLGKEEGYVRVRLGVGSVWIRDDALRSTVLDGEVAGEDTKTFGPYTKAQVSDLLAKITKQKMGVTGSNPWHIDTHAHGVTFDATYNPTSRMVTLKITGQNFYVSDAQVWSHIGPMMPTPTTTLASSSSSSSSSSAPVLAQAAPTAAAAKSHVATISPDVSMAPVQSALLTFDAALVPTVAGEWRGTRRMPRIVVGDDFTAHPPPDTATNAEKISWLTKAEQTLQDGIERLKSLPKQAQSKARDAGTKLAKAIDVAITDLMEHGAAGTLAPEIEHSARKIWEDNKNAIALLGGSAIGTGLVLAGLLALLAFKK